MALPRLELEPMRLPMTTGAATETSLPDRPGEVLKAWHSFQSWTDDQSSSTGN
jgi:hypothetical protein